MNNCVELLTRAIHRVVLGGGWGVNVLCRLDCQLFGKELGVLSHSTVYVRVVASRLCSVQAEGLSRLCSV